MTINSPLALQGRERGLTTGFFRPLRPFLGLGLRFAGRVRRAAPGADSAARGNLPRCLGSRSIDLIDELGAQFATDPPGQLALARVAGRKDDGEFGGNVEIFGDDLDAAVRHVRDYAVARQRAGPELNLRNPSTLTTFALASIYKHVGPLPCSIGALSGARIPSTEEQLE
jgi:hypothetical protein